MRGPSGNRLHGGAWSGTAWYRWRRFGGGGLFPCWQIADRKYRLALRAAATKSASRSWRTYTSIDYKIYNNILYRYMLYAHAGTGCVVTAGERREAIFSDGPSPVAATTRRHRHRAPRIAGLSWRPLYADS